VGKCALHYVTVVGFYYGSKISHGHSWWELTLTPQISYCLIRLTTGQYGYNEIVITNNRLGYPLVLSLFTRTSGTLHSLI